MFTKPSDIKDLNELISLAKEYKKDPYKTNKLGENKTICLVFCNPSLRTRISMQKAAFNLGMKTIVFDLSKDGWQLETEEGVIMDGSSQEHIKEAISVISSYVDIIGIRSFPKLKNREEDYQDNFLKDVVKYSEVPVISMESAIHHPLQSLADLMTINELANKKDPKIVLTWAPHPKALPQAVPNSFVEIMKESGHNILVTNPPGFDLDKEIIGNVEVVHNQKKALIDADFIYVKNWSSLENYGLVGKGYKDWIMDESKLRSANNPKVMHCLPVRRNVVISDEVLDGPNSVVHQQAKNREYTAQAVIAKILEDEE